MAVSGDRSTDLARRIVRTRLAGAALLAALALAAVGLPHTAAWQAANFLWLDPVTRWRAAAQEADPNIVVVAIDEYSLRAMVELAGSWPWPRSVHAELIEALAGAGAEAIVFDVMMSEPDRFRADHDAYLGEVLDRTPNVFLPVWLMSSLQPERSRRAADYPPALGLDPGPNADPDARLEIGLPAVGTPEDWQTGAINFLGDGDGRSRRYPVYLEEQGWRLPSLPARVLADLGHSLPDAAWIRIDWRAADQPAYHTRSYADLYGQILSGGLEPGEYDGRIVLIGATATGLHDLRATPLDAHYPGVYILANALDNLAAGERLRLVPVAFESLVAVLLVLAMAVAWRWKWRLVPLLAGLSVVSAALLVASLVAGHGGTLLPILPVLGFGWLLFLGLAVAQYWREYQARRQALDLFGRFLDPNVVGRLAEGGLVEQSTLAREGEISVLFSDVRGFTTLSEQRSAEEIMALLNDYFGRQVEVIFRHGGTLDKFIGDAVMAFWGAPLEQPDHARRSVEAALDMVGELERFRTERGLDDFEVGIGIHSGPAVVGMLGSERRYDYTAIGDTVNLASRIEGLTKGRARILVSEATRVLCGDAIDFESRGCYSVKGRTAEIAVHEPIRSRQ